eukprot:334438_1
MAFVAKNTLMGVTRAFVMRGGRLGAPSMKYAGGAAARWMSTKLFQESHEYAFIDGDNATVGITAFAAEALGDVVYVELPEVGDTFDKGSTFGSVESVKAASDVYSPVSGEVVAINEALGENPGLVNSSPLVDGWFMKLKMSNKSDVDGLFDKEAYQKHCDNSAH